MFIYLELVEFYILTTSRLYEMNDWISVSFFFPLLGKWFRRASWLEKAFASLGSLVCIVRLFSQV
jgi:hypothetical protein